MLFMYDKELAKDILKNIKWALDQIIKRFQGINSGDDFLKDDTGLEKLDSICMQLINIGEALKQVDKITGQKLLLNYPAVEAKQREGRLAFWFNLGFYVFNGNYLLERSRMYFTFFVSRFAFKNEA